LLVIPSVDVLEGRCVRLRGGREEEKRVYGDPLEWARRWEEEGASLLHVVDLDAALGRGSNRELLLRLLRGRRARVQVGGGIRSVERAEEYVRAGAERVVVGTSAVKNPELVRRLVEVLGGERVVVALDARGGRVVVEGWREETGKDVVELAREMEEAGVGYLLYTDVEADGRMCGIGEVGGILSRIRLPVILSGGVRSLEDVRRAREAGAAGLIVGTALYEGRFTLREAMEVAE
jgi:phosphoribosylformimino-5-aminoimidazole carboxamide ribotide isomerase